MHIDEYPGRPWKLAPDQMNRMQRAILQRVEAGPRPAVPPNISIWLHNEPFAEVAEHFGLWVSQLAPFSKREKEIVILVNAAYWNSAFEWHFHQAAGLRAGLTQEQIDAIRDKRDPGLSDPKEQVTWELAFALLEHRDVPDALHARAMQLLGHAGVSDIIGLMGLYSMIAQTIAFYRVPVPKAG